MNSKKIIENLRDFYYLSGWFRYISGLMGITYSIYIIYGIFLWLPDKIDKGDKILPSMHFKLPYIHEYPVLVWILIYLFAICGGIQFVIGIYVWITGKVYVIDEKCIGGDTSGLGGYSYWERKKVYKTGIDAKLTGIGTFICGLITIIIFLRLYFN